MQHRVLPVVAGATATGKTAVAVELARRINGEIISADSMQVYKHLSIGTAKPTQDELSNIKYHLVDHVEPDTQYHAGRFLVEANACIEDITARGRQPILCGGTGLYIRALLYGLYEGGEPDPTIRSQLEQRLVLEGVEALHKELETLDPRSASLYGPKDRQRVVRALEVFYSTGRPLSSYHTQDPAKPAIPAKLYVLRWPRHVLYDRINRRVDAMLGRGLLDEIKNYLVMGYSRDNAAIKALGYRELIDAVEGRSSLADALESMKKKSRNYAKRQETWFRSMSNVEWIECEGSTPEEVAGSILEHWEKLRT